MEQRIHAMLSVLPPSHPQAVLLRQLLAALPRHPDGSVNFEGLAALQDELRRDVSGTPDDIISMVRTLCRCAWVELVSLRVPVALTCVLLMAAAHPDVELRRCRQTVDGQGRRHRVHRVFGRVRRRRKHPHAALFALFPSRVHRPVAARTQGVPFV